MKRVLIVLCVLIAGCAYSRYERDTVKFEVEVRSPDGFAEKPKYEVVGRVTWEIRR